MNSITIGIHRGCGGFETKWAEAIQRHGGTVKWLNLCKPDALDQARSCDGIMWHFRHTPDELRRAKTILNVVEMHLRIPVFPDFHTRWHFDDKIAQYYLFKSYGIPTPETWIFWDSEDALHWAETADYPLVTKLAVGAGSSNVRLVRNSAEAKRWIRRMFSRSGFIPRAYIPAGARFWQRAWAELRQFALRTLTTPRYVFTGHYPPLPRTYWQPEKNYVFFQEFIPDNSFDTRVTVIGNRAFAFRRFNRPQDFRASGSGRFDVNPAEISAEAVRLAFHTAASLRSQSAALDLLFRRRDSQFVITEISYGYVDWMVAKCPGHWDLTLQWHEGSMWPEDAHVADFIERIRARVEKHS